MSKPITRTTQHMVAILGMLGSEFDGEVLAAARQAERVRVAMGLTWHQLLAPPPPSLAPPPPNGAATPWRHLAHLCRQRHDISEWEADFLANVGKQTHVSEKQRQALVRIAARLWP
jgi:hypothetical protein